MIRSPHHLASGPGGPSLVQARATGAIWKTEGAFRLEDKCVASVQCVAEQLFQSRHNAITLADHFKGLSQEILGRISVLGAAHARDMVGGAFVVPGFSIKLG